MTNSLLPPVRSTHPSGRDILPTTIEWKSDTEVRGCWSGWLAGWDKEEEEGKAVLVWEESAEKGIETLRMDTSLSGM